MTEQTAYIGLGTNLGELKDNLVTAIAALKGFAQIDSVTPGSFYETSPLGPADQPAFLNAVAKVQTTLNPRQLLTLAHQIENDMGRQRGIHWGPRTIDLDLLLYGDQVIDEPDFQVPHPQMHLRSFALKGLCEFEPDLVHPVIGRSLKELYSRLNGADFFPDENKPQLISIAGNIGVGKSTLATGLSQRLLAHFIPEKYEDNPYLADVYGGKDELALDSELFFLASGASQLKKDQLAAPKRYVSDYVFDKALIYASNWLDADDLATYKKHYKSVSDGVANPVLVIYLYDSLENCLDRIHRRNRPYEQDIQPDFLAHLASGYDTLYNDYTVCPVMRIRPDQCRDADQVDRIAKEIRHYII
ncbi:MAG: 2-amino-4-hydroxy-6-hydroxymethyldihydropteridine diphosphokinase [Planctomycetota bacterium]